MKRQVTHILSILLVGLILLGLPGLSLSISGVVDAKPQASESDLSQPANLQVVSTSPAENFELVGHLSGTAQAVQVVGSLAYVGFGSELAVLDISDPAHIQRIGWVAAAGEVMDIAIQGDLAYLAYHAGGHRGGSGLQIVNIRNPQLPVSWSMKEFSNCGASERIAIQGESAYFAFKICRIDAPAPTFDYREIRIFRVDVRNPAAPHILDSYDPGYYFNSAISFAVEEGWLYTLHAPSNQLVVFDISDPVLMVETASLQLSTFGSLALLDDYAYVVNHTGSLQLVDISDPTQPGIGPTYTVSGSPTNIYSAGNLIFIPLESQSILILDMTDPLNPQEAGIYPATGQPLDLFVQGAEAYSANGWAGLEIFEPGSLSQLGLQIYPSINDLLVSGDFAFSSADDGFWVLDLSDPRLPVPAAYVQTAHPAELIVLHDDYALVACRDEGIYIFDVSNPITPLLVEIYDLPVDFTQLVLQGSRLYAAARGDGITILEISAGYHLQHIGTYNPDYWINAMAVADEVAYLAASGDETELVVLDVSDPGAPLEMGAYDLAGPDECLDDCYGDALAIEGSQLLISTLYYVGNPIAIQHTFGRVHILDVSNPAEPVELGRIASGPYPCGVTLDNGHAYVSRIHNTHWEGVYLYDVHAPQAVQFLGTYPRTPCRSSTAEGLLYLFGGDLYSLRYLDPELPSLGGSIHQANNLPYPGVQISTGDPLLRTASDIHGRYALSSIPPGTYNVTPSLEGFIFSPETREASLPPSTVSQNFTILPEAVQADFTPGSSLTLSYMDTQGLPTGLDVPAGAASSPLNLQLVPIMLKPTWQVAFAGHAFELVARSGGDLLPGFTFEQPLQLSLSYSPQDTAVITDESQLALLWWAGSDWQDAAQSCSPAGEYDRDLANRTLSLPICQAGLYKLVGPTEAYLLPVMALNEELRP